MKGQISFVEFIISITVFITFSMFFFYSIWTYMPAYLNEVRSERVMSETYQISQLLINDPGDPPNWNSFPINRLGFSDENFNKTNYLSETKIDLIGQNPNNLCVPGYDNVKKWIDTDLDFTLIITDLQSGQTKLFCSPSPSQITARNVNVTVRRIVSFGSSYGELVLQMW